MFITWKSRPLKGNMKVAFLQHTALDRKHPDSAEAIAWKPLCCEHRGADRLAFTATVVRAERRDGQPRDRSGEREGDGTVRSG